MTEERMANEHSVEGTPVEAATTCIEDSGAGNRRPPEAPAPPGPVRLVTSARFVVEAVPVPAGIGGRNLAGFVEGEVENLSLFPLEATAWGYLGGDRRSAGESILIYAALRDQVNGATDSDQALRHAVLPGFAALQGRRWKRTTWISLLEPECLTLVRYPTRSSVPDFVRSRYGTRLEEHPAAAWVLMTELLDSVPRDPADPVEPGLIRCGTPTIDRRGFVRFPLECLRSPDAAWTDCGVGHLGPESVLLAADVRDRQFLGGEHGRRRAVRQIRGLLRTAAAAVLLLGAFQFQYARRSRQAAALAGQVIAQRPAVETLQQREALVRSAALLSGPPLEPFDLLMEINAPRPETVAFHTASFDREGHLGFTGEAPSVSVVNRYREALEKTGRYAGIDVREITSTKTGVNFTMQVRIGAGARNAPPAEEPP